MIDHCFLYWIFDETCVDPQSCGYVGITKNISSRMRNHRKKFQEKNWRYIVLYEGERHECLKLEFGLRPHSKMGWNISYGGNTRGCGGSKKGISKGPYSIEHRKNISKGLIGKAYSHKGKPNPKNALNNLGRKHTNSTIDKMRMAHTPEVRASKGLVHKGKSKIKIICIGCRGLFAPHIISRYHGQKCKEMLCESI